MPSTGDATLEQIQKEISEAIQRERELRDNYIRADSENSILASNCTDSITNNKPASDSRSSSPKQNGHSLPMRLFTQNPTNKGVMQRFIKARGRLSLMNTRSGLKSPTGFIETPRAVVPTGAPPRNGFVPVEQRIKKEFEEMQQRESELHLERQKSYPELLSLLQSPEAGRRDNHRLSSARSVSQLSDLDSFSESYSGQSSLKAAKSLSELCDIDDEEETQPLGSLSLIKQWENIIQKNQSAV